MDEAEIRSKHEVGLLDKVRTMSTINLPLLPSLPHLLSSLWIPEASTTKLVSSNPTTNNVSPPSRPHLHLHLHLFPNSLSMDTRYPTPLYLHFHLLPLLQSSS